MSSHTQTEKTLLHAIAQDGKTVHRWVVAVFVNKREAATYAGMIKMAHASGNADVVMDLDPQTPKTADGKPVTPVKLSTQVVPYSPHRTSTFGLDEDTPAATPAPAEPSK